MKKIFIIISTIFVFNIVNAAELNDVLNKTYQEASKKAEGFISNLISGQGDTEVSLLERNNENTEFSIMVVRPLDIQDDNVLFYQGQISQYDINKVSRQALNLGLGYRSLSDDGSYFSGVNTFFDIDTEENYRAGAGFELRSSSFEINGNYYSAISDQVTAGSDKNRALDGYDITAIGQAPFLPWADLVFTSYEWEADQNSKNSKGEIYKGQFYLTSTLSFEAGVDDNDITLEDNFFRLSYVYPPKDRTTLQDGFISDSAFENSDVRKEMLTKVKRSNKIVVEVEASGIVISNGNS